MVRALVATLSVALVMSLATGARADDVADEADLAFRLGAERYAAGDYKGALEHFLASNRLSPNHNVVFNVARTFEKLERYPEAYRYYSAALAGETDAAARARIEQALDQIRPHVAVLAIETDPPGATIYVDRKDLGSRGESPRSLGLAAGKYKIIAELPGYHPAEVAVPDAKLAETTHVALHLSPILGGVVVDGTPAGARVRVDNPDELPRCVIPCRLELSPGRHIAYVSLEGYRAVELPTEVSGGTEAAVHARLAPLTGSVVVTTDEPGTLVTVDGASAGFTPTILTLPVGAHRIGLALAGFRAVNRDVTVEAEKQARVDVVLTQAEEVQAASRVAESVEDAPSSVTIISREEITAFGYPTITEALRGVRGVSVGNDRAYDAVAFRGFGRLGSYGNRELVLQDGHPTNDDWIGSSYVGFDGRTDLGDVERIEVVRGPGSVLYGTNAFTGVINVVTRRDNKRTAEVGISAVDADVTRGRLRAEAPLGKDGGVWMSVAGAHGSGRDFVFPEIPNRVGEASPSRDADAFVAGTIQGRIWWKWLTMQWFAHSHDKQLPTSEYETQLSDPRTHQQDTRAFVEARAEPVVSKEVQLFTRLYLNFYQFRGDYSHTDPAAGLEHDTFDGRWVGAEQRVVVTPVSGLRLTLGGEGQYHYRVDQTAGDASGIYLDDKSNSSLGSHGWPYKVGAVYGLADVEPAKVLRLSGGVRLDAYSTFGSSLNPRVAAIVRPYEGGNTKILAGKAFRAPSIYELYYNDGSYSQEASPDLKPESIYSFEVEHSHRFSPTVTGLVSAYANYATGLILQQGDGSPDNLLHYENATTPLVTSGVEIAIRREWRQGFMLSASYGYSRAVFLESGSVGDAFSLRKDPNRRQVANAPEHLASFKGAVPLLSRALTAATRITFEGPRWDRNEQVTDAPQGRTSSIVIWDLILSGHEDRWGVRYAIGAYNVGGYRYSLPVSGEFVQRTIAQNGRTFLASVDVSF